MARPGGGLSHITVTMRETWVRLHSELPPTRVWAHDGEFPGPVINVMRGHTLCVTWKNQLAGSLPVVAVHVRLRS